MKTETITCDTCGKVFPAVEMNWEKAPTRIHFHLSAPRQAFESRVYEHVCYDCAIAIRDGFYALVEGRKP